MITLTYQGTTLDLDDRLLWVNEMEWSPVDQSTAYATDGSLIVDVATKQSGREILLQGTETNTWLTRTTLLQCMAWRALPAARFTLVLRGVSRLVIFDQAKGGFNAVPVDKLMDGEITDEAVYRPTFWFIEVEE